MLFISLISHDRAIYQSWSCYLSVMIGLLFSHDRAIVRSWSCYLSVMIVLLIGHDRAFYQCMIVLLISHDHAIYQSWSCYLSVIIVLFISHDCYGSVEYMLYRPLRWIVIITLWFTKRISLPHLLHVSSESARFWERAWAFHQDGKTDPPIYLKIREKKK